MFTKKESRQLRVCQFFGRSRAKTRSPTEKTPPNTAGWKNFSLVVAQSWDPSASALCNLSLARCSRALLESVETVFGIMAEFVLALA